MQLAVVMSYGRYLEEAARKPWRSGEALTAYKVDPYSSCTSQGIRETISIKQHKTPGVGKY